MPKSEVPESVKFLSFHSVWMASYDDVGREKPLDTSGIIMQDITAELYSERIMSAA